MPNNKISDYRRGHRNSERQLLRGLGQNCLFLPDKNAALQKETAVLQHENATLKQDNQLMYSKRQAWKIKIDDISDSFLCNACMAAKDAVYKREEGLIGDPTQNSDVSCIKKNQIVHLCMTHDDNII